MFPTMPTRLRNFFNLSRTPYSGTGGAGPGGSYLGAGGVGYGGGKACP